MSVRRSVCFVFAAILATTPALAQAPGVTTTVENDQPATAEVEALATPEARRAVEPLNWDETRGEGLRTGREAPETLPMETLTQGGSTAGGGMPNPEADATAEEEFPSEWEGLRRQSMDAGDDVGIAGTADVFTQYCENCSGLNLNYPMRAIGKLFTSRGTCSASVVSGNDVIVTAAHCCYDRGQGRWIGGFQFAPAYRDGYAPYGMFGWSSATVLNRWISVGDRRSDVCVIRLRPNSAGRDVTYYTGWLGRSWNWGTTQVHHSVGYPGNIGGGEKMQLCVSESFHPSSGCGGTTVLNTGCSMTYGASGGPWIRHYRSGNWVNAVVSGYDGTSCTGSFGRTFNGPRFTTDNIVTLCNAIGC